MNQWRLVRLQSLSVGFLSFGISADLAALTIIEAWGLYRFLPRLADG